MKLCYSKHVEPLMIIEVNLNTTKLAVGGRDTTVKLHTMYNSNDNNLIVVT